MMKAERRPRAVLEFDHKKLIKLSYELSGKKRWHMRRPIINFDVTNSFGAELFDALNPIESSYRMGLHHIHIRNVMNVLAKHHFDGGSIHTDFGPGAITVQIEVKPRKEALKKKQSRDIFGSE